MARARYESDAESGRIDDRGDPGWDHGLSVSYMRERL